MLSHLCAHHITGLRFYVLGLGFRVRFHSLHSSIRPLPDSKLTLHSDETRSNLFFVSMLLGERISGSSGLIVKRVFLVELGRP